MMDEHFKSNGWKKLVSVSFARYVCPKNRWVYQVNLESGVSEIKRRDVDER